MLRSITVALAVTGAVALGACGSDKDGASSSVSATTRVERAAQIELAAEPAPASAPEQGGVRPAAVPPPR